VAFLLVDKMRCSRDQLCAIYSQEGDISEWVRVDPFVSWDAKYQTNAWNNAETVVAYYVRTEILYVLKANEPGSQNLLFSINDDPEHRFSDPVEFLKVHNALSLLKFAQSKESSSMLRLAKDVLLDGLDEEQAAICLEALTVRFLNSGSAIQIVNEWTLEGQDLECA
jgi:hypothetical protein